MPANDINRPDYEPLGASSNSKKNGKPEDTDQQSLRPGLKNNNKNNNEVIDGSGLVNPIAKKIENIPDQAINDQGESLGAEISVLRAEDTAAKASNSDLDTKDDPEELDRQLSFAEKAKVRRQVKRSERDEDLLKSDNWLVRQGHTYTYVGLFCFSFLVLFRPYEIIPALGFLSATAYFVALATFAIYLPTQLATEGNFTAMSTEVKCILAMTVLGLVTVPIALSPNIAWETFNDNYIKAVLMFVVMVNVLRTRKRLMGLVWLSLLIGVYLSFSAWSKYMRGEFMEGGSDRIAADIGGMFGNPNDMALHLVIMTPIAITLGIASKTLLMRLVFFSMAALFVLANIVTFSRGGFLGLMAASAVLAWKLGRKYRVNVTIGSVVFGALVLILAPGNYGMRVLSIFIPGLDTSGSRGQRSELLWQSIIVTLRNPWGLGMGNFNIISIRHLASHNAYTQVSTELGILALVAYLIFIVSPLRKLAAIERRLFSKDKADWFFYFSIGLQASIIGYMVSSFFASVAYNWFIFYLIAYAVAFRRIYQSQDSSSKNGGRVQAEGLLGMKTKTI